MTALVAGFGNIFLSDDGFGSAVLRLLADRDLGADVRVRDFGTGGMHLALEMLGSYDLVVIVDAIARSDAPGTVFAVEIEPQDAPASAAPDGHDMTVGNVLALYDQLRAQSGGRGDLRVVLVGCVPENLEEGMGLSEPVRAALPAAADLVCRITRERRATGASR